MAKAVNLGNDIRKTQKKGLIRRQKIIDVAREILIRDGINGLVLRDIAVQLKITHGNLQYYFPTKEDLLIAVFDHETSKYINASRVVTEKKLTREEQITALLDSTRKELESDSTSLFLMLASLATQNKELAAIHKRANHAYEIALKKQLRYISPKISESRMDIIAQMITVIIDGIGIRMNFDNPRSPEMLELLKAFRETVLSWLDEGSSPSKSGSWVLSVTVSPADNS